MRKLSDAQRHMLECLERSPSPTCWPGDGSRMATRFGLMKRGLVEIRRITYNREDNIECYVLTPAGRLALALPTNPTRPAAEQAACK